MRRNYRFATAYIGVLSLSILFVATPASAKPGEYNYQKYAIQIDRQFSFECLNGVLAIENLVGTEKVSFHKNRQVNDIKIKGVITDSISGAFFRESQNYRIIFTASTVTFRGNLHSWHIPANEVRQSGVRVYDINSGLLISSRGRNDPSPNICYALASIQSRHR